MLNFEISKIAVGNPNSAEFNFAIKNQQQTIALAKYLKSIGIKGHDYEGLEDEVISANICIWADDIFIEQLIKELSKWNSLALFLFEKFL